MKKKSYLKPTMKVIVLHHRSNLLTGSLRSVSAKGMNDEDLDLKYSDESESGNMWDKAW